MDAGKADPKLALVLGNLVVASTVLEWRSVASMIGWIVGGTDLTGGREEWGGWHRFEGVGNASKSAGNCSGSGTVPYPRDF